VEIETELNLISERFADLRNGIDRRSWVGGDRPAEVISGIKKLREIGFDTFKLNGCEELGKL
jgi:galactonate dehydratase